MKLSTKESLAKIVSENILNEQFICISYVYR
jgi:hypothetical protein